jgi:heme/copper-type cytochrome/quinol oxidase subunit 2
MEDGITFHINQFWTVFLIVVAVFLSPILWLAWKMRRRPPTGKGGE